MSISAKVVATIAVAVVIPLIMGISLATDCFGISSGVDCADTSQSLPSHMVYTSGATFIGLATFGSVVGARVITGKNEEAEYTGAILMVGGAVGVILVQGMAMLLACCGNTDPTALCTFTLVTFVCSLLIVGGFAYIVENLYKRFQKSKQGTATNSGGNP